MNKFFNVLGILKPALEAAECVEQFGDALLDTLEEFIQRTDNKIDDAVMLPAIKGLRVVAGIADDQEKAKQEEEKNAE